MNIDECDSMPCQHNTTCTDLIDGYTCSCPDEYYGDHCEHIVDHCLLNTKCTHGATCMNIWGVAACLCSPGFMGKYCEKGNKKLPGSGIFICKTIRDLDLFRYIFCVTYFSL